MNLESMLGYVSRYGYFGIFAMLVFGIIGVPIPDETMLTFAGYLVYKGHLSLVPTCAAAWAGTTVGITTSFAIGRFFGFNLVVKHGARFGVTAEKLERAHEWFEKRGRWMLTAGYFIPGLRHAFAIAAGTSRVHWAVFALFAYTGGFVWSVGFIMLGYYMGETWRKVVSGVHAFAILVALAAAGAVAGFFVLRYIHRRRA